MQKQHGGELTFHANSKRVNEEQMWTRFIRITLLQILLLTIQEC